MYRQHSDLPCLKIKTSWLTCSSRSRPTSYLEYLSNEVIRWSTAGFVLVWGQTGHRHKKTCIIS